jgi:hypothetical protein
MTNFFSYVTQDELNSGELSLSANLLFTNASDFSQFIERTALADGRPCTAVILEYCDDKDIEPSDVAKLIGPSLKGKIEQEMIETGMLPDHTRLEW